MINRAPQRAPRALRDGTRARICAIALVASLLGTALAVPAQSPSPVPTSAGSSAMTVGHAGWPSRPIHLVLGYAPGGGTDSIARYLAERIREATGQAVVVENRVGAFGNIAAQAVANASADGHTLLFTPNSTHAANIHLLKKLPFDPQADFTPVTTLARGGFVLLVNPATLPVANLGELSALLKSPAGANRNFGSGNASGRIAAELYRQLSGVNAMHVPYKSVPQAINDLAAGQIHFLFADSTAALAQARNGKLRALAITTATRVSSAPELPTMAEAGLPGFELSTWFALFLPARTPMAIANRLAEIANRSLGNEAGREFLRRIGYDPMPGNPDSLARFVESETAKWGRIIRTAGIERE